MILDIFCVILNIGLLLLLKVFPVELLNYVDAIFISVVAIVFFTFYFSIQALAIWEMKSFVFNIYQFFNINAGTKAVEILKENKDKDNQA
jgi:membrane protein implicated in regulation of membrane protease activity